MMLKCNPIYYVQCMRQAFPQEEIQAQNIVGLVAGRGDTFFRVSKMFAIS